VLSSSHALAGEQQPPKRPSIKGNRWQEDWSVLSDPSLRTQPFDGLKYIPLSSSDPDSYVSFGATLRDRLESNSAAPFGIGGQRDTYLLQRAQIHVDLHPFEDLQIFTQIEDDRAFGKRDIGPADEDQLDLRLAFVAFNHDFDAGTFRARVGRQDFAFDLQRFVSSRDGPNVRQSFDAVWLDWDTGPWQFMGYVSQPVQYSTDEPFDDTSDDSLRFSTLRVERRLAGNNELSAYYSLYQRDNGRYLDGNGDEDRHNLDIRYAGTNNHLDWDLEAMGQFGTVGSKDIGAWALGARVGYTFDDMAMSPRVGLQFDMASGDHEAGDHIIGSFNPLFPNGSYFSQASYTGYSNLVHLKPSITIKPVEGLSLMGAVGLQWRETTADAVYTHPFQAVPGTAGKGGSWTGAYAQFRADYAFTPNLTGAVEAVRYWVGDTIQQAGGHDVSYFGSQLTFAW
jgi:hypothetical protein